MKRILSILLLSINFLISNAETDTVFTVSQNPFALSTQITIYNLNNDTITFKIYDIMGRVVADFFENLIISGTFTVTFNADTLPVGIYFAMITKNSIKYTFKLVKTGTTNSEIIKVINKKTISVFPNPTSDILKISAENLKITGIELYDLQGRKILNADFGSGIFDIKDLESGMYLLYLKTKDRTFVEKIIKE